MFKKTSLLIALSLTAWTSVAHAGFSGREPDYIPGIIPYVSYYEKGALPPHLIVAFDVDCSEKFLGVTRHDRYDPRSQSVIISIAGQTLRRLYGDCAGSLRKVEVDAGPTYSGRRYQIRQIVPAPQPQR